MKAIRTISIVSGRPEDSGKRIKVSLFKNSEAYRWFGGNPGESPKPSNDHDTEVSGTSVSEACENARRTWAGSDWDLRAKSLNF